jgi:hypothetical protein
MILAPFGTSLVTEHIIEENGTDNKNIDEFRSLSHIESFVDMPKVNDCTVGMHELEDATADA